MSARARISSACLGEGHPPLFPAPCEELGAQLRLQLHELAGEGGLGDVEHLGRGRDALRLGHREKISQHPQFHGSASFPCIGFSITAVFMPYKHIKLF